VDTHKDTHTAAVLDATGRLLGHRQFPTTPAGYALLLAWLRGHGELDKVGIEGTGVYGAGLALYLRVAVVELVEVDRPDRKARPAQGKVRPGRRRGRIGSTPPGPRRPDRPAVSPRTTPVRSRRCALCGSPAAARSRPALRLAHSRGPR
jgi:hypothetical protein